MNDLERIEQIIISQFGEFTLKDLVVIYIHKYGDCNMNAIKQKARRVLKKHISVDQFEVFNGKSNEKIYRSKSNMFELAGNKCTGTDSDTILFYSKSMKNSNQSEKLKNLLHKYETSTNKPKLTPMDIKMMYYVVNNPEIKTLKKERYRTILYMLNKNMLTEADRKELLKYFQKYIEQASEQNLVLERIKYDKEKSKYLMFPYLTRFTNSKQLKRQLAQYNCVFEQTAKKYKYGVHLTLTTDPKRFDNIVEANKHFGKAFNRFMSFLAKYNKNSDGKPERPKYLAAYEYTKSGLLHAHILIFGKKYLMDQKLITREWSRCGQGQIAHIYGIRREGINWVYNRNRPEEVKTGEYKNANEYLKKYLVKTLYSELDGSMYWSMNKRFYTMSKSLKPDMMTKAKPAEKMYNFVGIWTDDELTVNVDGAFKAGLPYKEIKKIFIEERRDQESGTYV